jgi:hypothetical protein
MGKHIVVAQDLFAFAFVAASAAFFVVAQMEIFEKVLVVAYIH